MKINKCHTEIWFFCLFVCFCQPQEDDAQQPTFGSSNWIRSMGPPGAATFTLRASKSFPTSKFPVWSSKDKAVKKPHRQRNCCIHCPPGKLQSVMATETKAGKSMLAETVINTSGQNTCCFHCNLYTIPALILSGGWFCVLPWLPPSVASLNTSSKESVSCSGSWMVKTLDASKVLLTASSMEAE